MKWFINLAAVILAIMYEIRRKVHRAGDLETGSLLIALPKIWTRAHGVKKGDTVTMRFNGVVQIISEEAGHITKKEKK